MTAIRWVATDLDPHRMIAVATLDAARVLLRSAAAGGRPSGAGGPVNVRVAEHAALNMIGGLARVDGVAVVRIGRSSFVAYQLDRDDLRELPVEVAAAPDGTLRVSVQRPTLPTE